MAKDRYVAYVGTYTPVSYTHLDVYKRQTVLSGSVWALWSRASLQKALYRHW